MKLAAKAADPNQVDMATLEPEAGVASPSKEVEDE
jgi:hypothetical protein